MTSICDKNMIEIVSLKRPTAVEKLGDTITKPKGAIPNFGLPKWKVMPLESKIPMVPGPEGAYNFTRRKVGKPLWVSMENAEFNMSDPNSYEMKLSYDSLHDKHLVPFFSNPRNIRRLIKAGLIAENLDAKCSLKDYNMYRIYLRKLHCDAIKRELRKRAMWSAEERALQYADDQAQKEVKRVKARELLVKARWAVIEKRKLAEKLKLEQRKEKEQKIQQRLERLALEKEESRRLQFAKSRLKAEAIQEKLKIAANIRRHRIIQTLLDWSKKEQKRTKMREARLTREREEKIEMVQQKWQTRQILQKEQIEKEQKLLQCVDEQRKEFVEAYQGKINRETERMKKQLEEIKMFIKCYMARRITESRERICCKREKSAKGAGDKSANASRSGKGKRKKLSRLKEKEPLLQKPTEEEDSNEEEIESPPESSADTNKSTISEPKEKCKCAIIKAMRIPVA